MYWNYRSDPPLFDGNEEVYTSLRLLVECPLEADAPCASGVLRFSPACLYAVAPSDCVLFLEDGAREPLLTFRSFTICLGDFRRGDTDDGALDISDAMRIFMDFFIAEDTNIPSPGPFERGADPSPDDLDCNSSKR